MKTKETDYIAIILKDTNLLNYLYKKHHFSLYCYQYDNSTNSIYISTISNNNYCYIDKQSKSTNLLNDIKFYNLEDIANTINKDNLINKFIKTNIVNNYMLILTIKTYNIDTLITYLKLIKDMLDY